jgi:hypothetical protein
MDTQTLLNILGIGVGILGILAQLDRVIRNLKKIGGGLRGLLLNIGHPLIALGAALAALFILAAPAITSALPNSLPRYEIINRAAEVIPFIPWFVAMLQALLSRGWGWLVSLLLVGGGAYLVLFNSSWGDNVLVLLYLLPIISALLFSLASPRDHPAHE